MGNDKKPKDLMADILDSSTHTHKDFHGVAELSQLIQDLGRNGKEAGASQNKRNRSGRGSLKKRRPKKKTTHYLLQEIFIDLDAAVEKIKGIMPEEIRSRVTKSAVVNHALKDILDEFDNNGEKSQLVKYFLDKNEGD